MNTNDDILRQAEGIFRFIRENLNKEYITDQDLTKYIPLLKEKLYDFSKLYKNTVGTELINDNELMETEALDSWKDMLDVFKKVVEIIWNLEKWFPEYEDELTENLELDADEMKTVKLLLIGIILRKSKRWKKKQNIKKAELLQDQDEIIEKSFKSTSDILDTFEQFVLNRIPEIPEVKEKTLFEKNQTERNFIESYKQIIPWYLIYYTAGLELEGENRVQRNKDNKEAKGLKDLIGRKRDAINNIMKLFFEHQKQRESYPVR